MRELEEITVVLIRLKGTKPSVFVRGVSGISEPVGASRGCCVGDQVASERAPASCKRNSGIPTTCSRGPLPTMFVLIDSSENAVAALDCLAKFCANIVPMTGIRCCRRRQ